ncbi:MAG: DUF3842 family protein [Bacillota bacterium]|nr:DUF3842 family protein [Bacillota bacterium]
MEKVLIIDGQGGGLGRQLVSELKKAFPELQITAVGTNSLATSAMLKAGADHCATGENAVLVAARKAEYILGPLGILIADALLGEITPAMALAVAQSPAKKILLPVNQCGNIVVGINESSHSRLIPEAVEALRQARKQETCRD